MSASTLIRVIGFGLVTLVVAPAMAVAGSGPVDPESEIAPNAAPERVMPEIPNDARVAPPEAPVDQGKTSEVPTVEYDVAKLPTPVRRLREQIIEAASTGDIEKLRPIIDANDEPPIFSYSDIGDDPIEYLRSLSTDPEGREILAILIDMLDAGYVHVGVGTPQEMYVWPYFAYYPVELLTGPQIVELLRIVYPGDYEDMKTYGTYLSYRVGLGPDGTWRYFVAGD
jgi:hypothetical protein